MGVVLDFGTAVADGTTAVPVSFDSNGESSVLPFTARYTETNEGRLAPNPLLLYSDRIRVGTSSENCQSATWGVGIDDIGLVDDTGVQLYMQFRRYESDGTDEVSLTDSVGMIADGFVTLGVASTGITVSIGVSAGVNVLPTSSQGTSVSIGTAIAFGSGSSAAYGTSVSLGTAVGVGVNPTSSNGVSISLGDSVAVNVQPMLSEGTSVSLGTADGEAVAGGPILSETWDTLDTGVWDIREFDETTWANGAGSASVVGGNLRIANVGGGEESGVIASAVVETDDLVVDASTDTKRVTFNSVPTAVNTALVVVGITRTTVEQAAAGPQWGLTPINVADTIQVFFDGLGGGTKVLSDGVQKYSGGNVTGATIVIEVGPTNAVVKKGGVQIWSGAHNCGFGTYRVFLTALDEVTANFDFGDVVVEAV